MPDTTKVADAGDGGAGFYSPGCGTVCGLRTEADLRIADHLTMLSAYLRLKGGQFDPPASPPSRAAVQRFVQALDGQIRAVVRLHRLLTSAPSDLPVDLATVLHEVCAPFVGGMDRRIVLVEDVSAGCVVAPEQVMSLSQVVSESITNAVKHAFPGGGAGVILVRGRRELTGDLTVEIVDNGVGLPKAFDPDRDGGFGLHLVRGLSQGLKAPLTFDCSREGLRVSLSLPGAAS